MASSATKLFAGSRNQTFQDAEFRTAGNDFYSPTYNIHFSSPSILASELPNSQTAPVSEQSWGRIIQQLSGFFRSAENQGALVHGGTAAEGETARPVQVQYSVQNAPNQAGIEDTLVPSDLSGKEDEAGQPKDNSEQSPDDCLITPMGELDLKSTGTTSAEIYTRSMLSATTAGLACWHPQPRKPAGEGGIVPGDVGTFNLTHGFRKIFNVWEDESLPDVARCQLPLRDCAVYSDEFAEGHTIVSGTSSRTVRSQNGRQIEWFEFRCQSEQGAVLACTASADLEELVDSDTLRDFLIQHAGTIYQHAISIRRISDEDSLYIVSGCIKTNSWAIAAYRDPAEAPDDLLTLSRRTTDSDQVSIYDWINRGTAEARFGPNSSESGSNKRKDQCLFLQGFKLALSRKFRTRLKGLQLSLRDGHPSSSKGASQGPSPNDDGRGRTAGQGSSQGNHSGFGTSNTSGSLRDGDALPSEEFQVSDFPDLSGGPTFHPCDKIAELLLEITGADCALSHDDDWRKRSDEMSPWNDNLCFDIIASRTIIARNGVACLLPRSDYSSQDMEQGTLSTNEEVENDPRWYWQSPYLRLRSQGTPSMTNTSSCWSTPSIGLPSTPGDFSPFPAASVYSPFPTSSPYSDPARFSDPWGRPAPKARQPVGESPGINIRTGGMSSLGGSPAILGPTMLGTVYESEPFGGPLMAIPAQSAWGVDAVAAGLMWDTDMMPVRMPAMGLHGTGPAAIQQENPQQVEADQVHHFMEGEDYGPVLTPMIVRIVEAKLQLNPALLSPLQAGSNRPYLTWNLLLPTSDIHYSPDPIHKSWSTGRNSPATFPRTTQLLILTEPLKYPWCIPVDAQNEKIGVTCGEIMDAVERSMKTVIAKKDWDTILSTELRNEVLVSYKRNRGRGEGLDFRVPGGELGGAMVRMDFLRDSIHWGGLEVLDTHQPETEGDHQFIMRKWLNQNGQGTAVRWPCTLVLRLDSVRSRFADRLAEREKSRGADRLAPEQEKSRYMKANSAARRSRKTVKWVDGLGPSLPWTAPSG